MITINTKSSHHFHLLLSCYDVSVCYHQPGDFNPQWHLSCSCISFSTITLLIGSHQSCLTITNLLELCSTALLMIICSWQCACSHVLHTAPTPLPTGTAEQVSPEWRTMLSWRWWQQKQQGWEVRRAFLRRRPGRWNMSEARQRDGKVWWWVTLKETMLLGANLIFSFQFWSPGADTYQVTAHHEQTAAKLMPQCLTLNRVSCIDGANNFDQSDS